MKAAHLFLQRIPGHSGIASIVDRYIVLVIPFESSSMMPADPQAWARSISGEYALRVYKWYEQLACIEPPDRQESDHGKAYREEIQGLHELGRDEAGPG